MHKTGTSSVQFLLSNNREALLKAGIHYPLLTSTHHQILSVKRWQWTPAGCLEALEGARREGAETLLMSSETVSTLSAEQFKTLTRCFAGFDLTYLFSFRHWRDYWPSRWAQNCSRRDTQNLDQYVNGVAADGSQHIDYRFDLILDRALSSGNCRVKVVSYDNAEAAEGSVVPTLLRAAGLSNELIVQLEDSVRHHMRKDAMLLELSRLLNGVVAHRRNLPQDDLSRALGEHRPCNGRFDLLSKIARLPVLFRDEMLTLIADHAFETWICPNIRVACDALSEKHADRFVNRLDGRVFVERPALPNRYSTMHWPNFLDAVGAERILLE